MEAGEEGGNNKKKKRGGGEKKKKEDGEMRVATSPARLQVNQLPVLGDKRMKYAASNWTLVNQGGVWGGGDTIVRMGDGLRTDIRGVLMKGTVSAM